MTGQRITLSLSISSTEALSIPLTFFLLGKTDTYSLVNNYQKHVLDHETLDIVRCIRTHLLCAFASSARGSSRAGRRLSQLHYGGRAKGASKSYHWCYQHSTWRVLVV